jgi:hypothetical protein
LLHVVLLVSIFADSIFFLQFLGLADHTTVLLTIYAGIVVLAFGRPG